ncbi:MAG: glycosyltransferase family 2 protein [Sutterellaceae bacterium]|nr:glycosyltransferase family 2 protein [Sutterellaceae bacterium]MDY2869001.1 glycosyltransferase family 2 protein [Mesosutterella sp.]
MKISVIVTTYNRPDALRLVLDSLSKQTDRNFEIDVADDGSRQETRDLVESFAKAHREIPTLHFWQEDKGFRRARILNKAAAGANGEYLVFIDGDCVVPPDFVSKHRSLAEFGHIVAGSRILTGETFARDILSGKVDPFSFGFWSLSNLFRLSQANAVNRWLPALSLPLGILRKAKPRSWKIVRGCNWAIWKRDYERVDGFDESFEGWGGEDSDIVIRLLNSGIRVKSGRLCIYVLHLWHQEVSRENSGRNFRIVYERLRNGATKPEKGMSKAFID